MVAGWLRAGKRQPVVVAAGRARLVPISVPITEQTWFDLASLTKPLVTGTLSVLSFRAGELSPGTRVSEVLSATAGAPLGDRTVEQLLTHTSGLPAWEPLYCLAGDPGAGLIDALGGLPMGEAGGEVVYSCLGFITVARMIEEVTGRSLGEIFRDRVTDPLGVGDRVSFALPSAHDVAGGALHPGVESDLVQERGLDPSRIPPMTGGSPDDGNARFIAGVSGNAGLFGTAVGVLELARIYFEPGFLTREEIAQATTDRTAGFEQGRGWGWQMARSPGSSAGPALTQAAFGHNGFTGTSLWIDPLRGTAMVLLTNRNHPGHRLNDLHPLRRRYHQLVV
jgi:CubicO group peptidase (beta-lactamase class C family)